MVSVFSSGQRDEVDRAARAHSDAHVRSRALAVRAVALGYTRRQVAAMLPLTACSVGQATSAYCERGLAAFEIAPGRGRRSAVDDEQVLSCLRRSPERFGHDCNRWTLRLLAQTCPSLRGMSGPGVLKVLHRLGFRYQHGQPWIHGPDPRYEGKKTPSKRPARRRAKTPRR